MPYRPRFIEDIRRYYTISQEYEFSPNLQLQYVKFNTDGLSELLRYYKEEKNLNLPIQIEEYVLEFRLNEDENLFNKKIYKILEIYDSLENGQLKALIFLNKSSKYNLSHATPYIVVKNNNELTLIQFEYEIKKIPTAIGKTKYVPNYSRQKKLQVDSFSCATFCLNTLKNCFLDQEFIESCFDENSQTKPVKERIGQQPQFEESFKPPYRATFKEEIQNYIQNDEGKFNLKAWYKGHDYARKINPEHLDFLDDYNRNLFEKISKKRLQFKRGVDETEFDEVKFDDVDFDELLPDGSVVNPLPRMIKLKPPTILEK